MWKGSGKDLVGVTYCMEKFPAGVSVAGFFVICLHRCNRIDVTNIRSINIIFEENENIAYKDQHSLCSNAD